MQSRQTDPNRGRAGKAFLALERLEARDCPSAAVFQNHALVITSTGTSDTITISDSGNGTVIYSVSDGKGHTVKNTVKGVTSIEVTTPAKGDDHVNYALTAPLTTSEQITLALGSDNVQANLNFSKGVSAPSLKVQVHTGSHSDQVDAVFGAIKNTKLSFNTTLAGYNDQFAVHLDGALTGTAQVLFNTVSGPGYNGIDITAQGNIASTAALTVDTTGGAVTNTVHVDYSGQLDGKLTIHTQGGRSYSLLESVINLAAGSTGSLSAQVLGGAVDDLLILEVKDSSTHLKSFSALLEGIPKGHSLAIATSNVKVVNSFKV
jgi:hypothetical protein